jgi:hypothetical protein
LEDNSQISLSNRTWERWRVFEDKPKLELQLAAGTAAFPELPAGSFGALVFTNTPDATTNNFWRIRSVP